MDVVFLTDLHIKLKSNVRNGDLLTDLCDKLRFVIDYCNSNNAILLLGGDVFDKPSVPDVVKNTVMPIFRSCVNGVYGISGNHDRLYDNPEFNNKISWTCLTSSGVVTDLDKGNVDLGDFILTSTLPIIDYGKPCIAVYHGFLNKDDGRNTFRFTDISGDINHDTFILLGHDHVVYDPVQFTSYVRIYRPGSFNRQTRAEESMRNPQLLHIKLINGRLKGRMVPIKCRDFTEIFDTKEVTISKSQQSATYESIIQQISNASKTQMSFRDAIGMVSSPDVVEYCCNLLQQSKLDSQTKKQNL